MSRASRYSYAGSEEFEHTIHKTLHEMGPRLASAFGPLCVALVLGGGYGRGEGACVVQDGKESLYNDFDLFVITKKQMEIPPEVKEIAHEYEHLLGIDVDIGKPIPVDSLATLPHELMWQDMFDGHKVIFGDPQLLTAKVSMRIMDPLPKVEAIRLLLNRGSGLLQTIGEAYAIKSDKDHKLPDEDFIRRNYQKCALALGDALLIALEKYRPPLDYRRNQVESLQEFALPEILSIQSAYGEAAEFKVNPGITMKQPSPEQLERMANLWTTVFLWIEEKRTGKHWQHITQYADDCFIREPKQHRPGKIPRNLLKQMRYGVLSWRYPREALYGELGLLLDSVQPEQAAWRIRSDSFLSVWHACN